MIADTYALRKIRRRADDFIVDKHIRAFGCGFHGNISDICFRFFNYFNRHNNWGDNRGDITGIFKLFQTLHDVFIDSGLVDESQFIAFFGFQVEWQGKFNGTEIGMRNLKIIGIFCSEIHPHLSCFVFEHYESAAVALKAQLTALFVGDILGSHLNHRKRQVVVIKLIILIRIDVDKARNFFEGVGFHLKLCEGT